MSGITKLKLGLACLFFSAMTVLALNTTAANIVGAPLTKHKTGDNCGCTDGRPCDCDVCRCCCAACGCDDEAKIKPIRMNFYKAIVDPDEPVVCVYGEFPSSGWKLAPERKDGDGFVVLVNAVPPGPDEEVDQQPTVWRLRVTFDPTVGVEIHGRIVKFKVDPIKKD